jgi:predicted ester cyclase
MPESPKDLVQRHFEEVFNGRRLDVCDEIVADDFVEHAEAPFGTSSPGSVHGPTALRGTIEWLLGIFPDLHMTLEAIVAEGDTVAARVLAQGTQSGTVDGGPPPSGRRFAARQSHWFRVREGRLAEHWATRDDLTTMLQLGVVQEPGTPAGR